MPNSDYLKDVRRLGGLHPYVDDNGVHRNLNQQTKIDRLQVVTDGLGNIVDMPLLTRKPCFARPERYLRGAMRRGRTFSLGEKVFTGETICERCPAYDACSIIVFERIESNSLLDVAYDKYFEIVEPYDGLGLREFRGELGKRWEAVLCEIEAHGGWTNVNDARASAHELQKDIDQAKRSNAAKRAKRKRERIANSPAKQIKSIAFENAVLAERNRRSAILQDVTAQSGLRPQSRLSVAGCERVATVWMANETLKRNGAEPTCKEIAQWLIGEGLVVGVSEATLTTRSCEDKIRIKSLERHTKAGAVWSKFKF